MLQPGDLPLLDRPNIAYSMAVRDRAAADLVSGAGGRILLTGEGGDSLLAGTMFFFADWLVSGRAQDAVREMAHRAALGRVSFWSLAYENAVLPLLPASMRRALTKQRIGSTPPWIPAQVRRRYGFDERSAYDDVYGGRRGHKYDDALAAIIDAIPSSLPLGPMEERLEVRHPYLHRPLVELALTLPPEACVRPHARKWILREAMRGILPEKVRTRVGKGRLDGLNVWSLVHDAQQLNRLLRDPILAQLGRIDPIPLRRILDDVRNGRAAHEGWRDRIKTTLDIELWLQLRSGRWADSASQRRSTTHVQLGSTAGSRITGQVSRSTL